MSVPSSRAELAVQSTLSRCARRLVRPRAAEWSFDLGNGKPFPVAARSEEQWLRLVAPADLEQSPDTPWRALLLNGLLRGGVRLVRHPRPLGIVLQDDVSLADEQLVPARLEAACTAFRDAMPLLTGKSAAGPGPEQGPALEKDDAADAALVQLARERGWALEPREPQRFSAELDAPGLLSQAWLERREGELRLWIEVLRGATLSECSRRAAGLFVLTLTGQFRMVRGWAVETPSHAVRLEVRLPPVPTAAELDLALAALSLACRLCTRELKGLSDTLLAGTYLDHMTMEN